MKIPAIRGKIGNWVYYTSVLSFEQVSQHVEKIDSQLHQSEGLKDMIQRSITNNFEKIRDYIINQPEMFFNSLVLGVYNGVPEWIEVELNLGDEEFFNLGFLDFPGTQKIFPIDGQHRVEGIKDAILKDSTKKNNQIGVIFVGHSITSDGMQKSRRLFSTLNRYAKPVTMDDIIALDEDDSIAITTRNLLETFTLFSGKRVTKSKNKAIHDGDKTSITSIITLYQCNRELLKQFRKTRKAESPNPNRDKKGLEEYLKFRPKEEEVTLFDKYCFEFWEQFQSNLNIINTYISEAGDDPARNFRNSEDGGNLLFRPVGLLPFVQASIEIHKRKEISFEEIFNRFNEIDLSLNEAPWVKVLWNPIENIMQMGNQGLTKLLLMYLYDSDILRPAENKTLYTKYAVVIGFEGNVKDSIKDIPSY